MCEQNLHQCKAKKIVNEKEWQYKAKRDNPKMESMENYLKNKEEK